MVMMLISGILDLDGVEKCVDEVKTAELKVSQQYRS